MVRVSIDSLALGSMPGLSIMTLRPVDDDPAGGRVLPICIGNVEAASIAMALGNSRTARPMTHSLLANVMAQLGGTLEKVVIDKVRGTVFYATLYVDRCGTVHKVDARPSDAVAVAVRLKRPIFVESAVLESASFPSWVNAQREQDKAAIAEFHEFVDGLSPEDFLE